MEEYASIIMKVVNLMECVPGDCDDGRPITVITFAHLGEVEAPLMLTMRDTERLCTDLLVSLAEHGCKTSQEILDRYFERED
jgi:hypothetical protein